MLYHVRINSYDIPTDAPVPSPMLGRGVPRGRGEGPYNNRYTDMILNIKNITANLITTTIVVSGIAYFSLGITQAKDAVKTENHDSRAWHTSIKSGNLHR